MKKETFKYDSSSGFKKSMTMQVVEQGQTIIISFGEGLMVNILSNVKRVNDKITKADLIRMERGGNFSSTEIVGENYVDVVRRFVVFMPVYCHKELIKFFGF